MVKVRFLKSVHGAYGEANPGDEKDVSKSLAHELITSGIAETMDAVAEKPAETEQPQAAAEAQPITSESFAAEPTEVEKPAEDASVEEPVEDDTPQARRAARRRQAD